ncbi:hypothetical protein HY992_02080 [Candidatus Micrarchaeota archaeon]|nr:hypothetical protein [Candidatus Micrarchaeota archaeon]
MANVRGRRMLVRCAQCGRSVPRGKAVTFEKGVSYSTDLRNPAEDIKYFERMKVYYCPSCGKHLHIYDKKKAQMMRKYNK